MTGLDLPGLEEQARQVLPASTYDFLAGGADDELTLCDSLAAWSRLRLWPRVLRDVAVVDTSTTVLGAPVAAPILVAPIGYQRLVRPEGEAATASGTARAGTLMVVATRSSVAIEDVARAVAPAPWWFQVYVLRDRSRTADLVARAAEAGCRALVLTGDTPVLGRRMRDERNAFRMHIDLESSGRDRGAEQDPSITFAAVEWLAGLAGLPVVVKGVLRADDARTCLDAGAAAITVSNHGGRQLDTAVASADALPAVVDAVAGRGEVYVDGGVRRGSDIVKALALGARAVMVGRPVVWGLAVDGVDGVAHVVEGLRAELARAMALCGAASVGDVTSDLVMPGT
ncbi:MAG: alpha-hydroxy-acid oxidizing protein [Actinobacteria bacterium]|nr:MAG: alpha-hydroxy-acid oxidizing protein [Actinomycetota bacterium]